jgi:DNA modification methylase
MTAAPIPSSHALAVVDPASALQRLEDAVRLLAEARDLDEVKAIRNLAEAARVYARQAQLGLEAQNHAAEIKLRAERRAGELVRDLPRNEGVRFGRSIVEQPPRLQDLGISRAQSHRWQAIASVPLPTFEEHLAEAKLRGQEITSAAALRLAAHRQRAAATVPPAVPPLARPARVLLVQADVRAGLQSLEPASAQMCVTSVPYWGLRSYGTEPQVWGGDMEHAHAWAEVPYVWSPGGNGERSILSSRLSSTSASVRQALKRPHAASMGTWCSCGAWRGELGSEPTPGLYVEHITEVFGHVWRAVRADGTLWLNIGSSYAGSGKGPSGWSGLGDQIARQGFTGEGAKYAAARAQGVIGASVGVRKGSQHGESGHTSGVTPPTGYKSKDLIPIPWLVGIALQQAGWYWRSTIAWCKKAPMPESVDDRPTSAWEPILLLSKSRDYYYDADAVREEQSENTHARFGANGVRSTGGPKSQSADEELIRNNDRFHRHTANGLIEGGRNMRNVWLLGPEPFPEAHFAVFPTEIPRRCILAGSRPGDLVLDPFAGAGTTSLVAARLGRDSVGIELKPEYVAMAETRIRADGGFTVDVTTRIMAEPV